MKTIRTRVAVPVAIVAALLLAPALSACSSVSGIVNGAVEDASGGNVSVGALPSGWPDEVPVIEGDIVGGGKIPDGDGWMVIIKSDAADPIADAQTQLEAAGFTTPVDVPAESIPGLEDLSSGSYFAQNANYTVVVAGSEQGVIYTVVPTP